LLEGGTAMKKAADNKQQAETKRQPTPSRSTREKEFDEAVERVYRRYGTDLSGFHRDVQKEMVKRG